MQFTENLQTKYRLVTEKVVIIFVVAARKALQKFLGGLSICIFY